MADRVGGSPQMEGDGVTAGTRAGRREAGEGVGGGGATEKNTGFGEGPRGGEGRKGRKKPGGATYLRGCRWGGVVA